MGELEDVPSGFTCPECHGALWWNGENPTERYRCRVGHTYAPGSLFSAQSLYFEEAIWAAFRALEESADLARRLAARARSRSLVQVAERYERKHAEALERAHVIKAVLDRGQLDAEEGPESGGRENQSSDERFDAPPREA